MCGVACQGRDADGRNQIRPANRARRIRDFQNRDRRQCGLCHLGGPCDQWLETGDATVTLDLTPDRDLADVTARLAKPRGKNSLGNHLRKTLGLDATKTALIFETTPRETLNDPAKLASAIKALPLKITKPRPIDEAISTAGGVAWEELDENFQLKNRPGTYCLGEMVDWEAPTGGYLLTACLMLNTTYEGNLI